MESTEDTMDATEESIGRSMVVMERSTEVKWKKNTMAVMESGKDVDITTEKAEMTAETKNGEKNTIKEVTANGENPESAHLLRE